MTALDTDTLRDLRNLVEQAKAGPDPTMPREWSERTLTVTTEIGVAAAALLNAAPALLDAAEAVERIRTLADDADARRGALDFGPGKVTTRDLRAALAPPPDRSKP